LRQFSVATTLRNLVGGILLCFASVAGAGSVQRLDEGWEFHQGTLGSIWEIWRGDAATDNVKWTPVTVPHCFNARDAVDPDAHYYEGPGWYRTHLTIANPFPNGRTLLHFEGAGQKSKVFVGLNQVGEHVGGYDEWDVDITAAATNTDANGELPVAVLCDNSRDAEMIPSDLSDFCRYGGLYRHVNLVYVPATSLAQVHITPKLAADGTASVQVRAQLFNPTVATDNLQLVVEVRDLQGNLIQTVTKSSAPWPGEKEIASFQIASPKLWSPASPSLYHCTVALKSATGEQTLENHFGVRSVEWVAHGPFKLNGERLLLRGTQYHEDDAGVGAAVSDVSYRRTFEQIKAMGANFVRLGHYQQSPQVLDLCDRLGLLVWEEVPWCRGGVGGVSYQQQCRDMLTDMINQHYNHPSVILWSLGNEIDWPGDFSAYNTNAIRQFLIQQNTLAHQLDPTRQTALRRCDFCRDILDVYSPSIWAGWYSGRYTEYRKAVGKSIAENKHFFHAEWGADSVAGRHAEEPEKFLAVVATGQGTAETGSAYKANGGKARASRDGDWSESYAINLFDWTLHEQETMSNLTGSAMWLFRDFPTPLRPENPVPLLNQKGVVQRDGTPKESYYVFQSYWSDQPMIHIYGHTWPVRWGKAGEPREVKVFSNCRKVELFVNGISAGVKQRNNADFPAAGLRWNVPFNEGTNTLRALGRSDGAVVADVISQIYQTAAWDKPAKLALNEIAQTNGVATIEARLFDKDGVPCLDATNMVRFGLAGDGRLLDDLGTEGGSRVLQLCNGRAQISLQLTGQAAMTSVSSDGLNTVFLKVEHPN
jgi:beta-galactosidase